MRGSAILAMLALAGCGYDSDDAPGIAGSGGGGARSYPVADFTSVALRGADDVDVRVGGAFSVRAEGDPAALDHLKITRDGDTLTIGRRDRAGFSWGGRTVRVYVTMPRIVGGTVLGSGDLAIDRAEGSAFAANAAGSGTLAVATLAVDTASFDVAGSGGVRAAGTAGRARVNVAGSGAIAASGLRAARADVSIAGSGSVAMTVAGPAKVSIMGSGDVDLGPAARCSVSKLGSGSVRCGG